MGKLFFENSNGIRREIATNISREECMREIKNFIDSHNKNKPKNQKFKSYYTRTWEENGETVFDIGSWSEYFYWNPKI